MPFILCALLQDTKYKRHCEASGLSTVDQLLSHTCNEASKRMPIAVSLSALTDAMRNAVDVIGATSLWMRFGKRARKTPAAVPAKAAVTPEAVIPAARPAANADVARAAPDAPIAAAVPAVAAAASVAAAAVLSTVAAAAPPA